MSLERRHQPVPNSITGSDFERIRSPAKEILNDEYQLFVDLKSHYKDRIAADIDSFMRAEIDESSFQQKMKQYQQDFCMNSIGNAMRTKTCLCCQ